MFLQVNKEKFNGITNDQFLELKDTGAVPIIYGHLSSLFALPRLAGKTEGTGVDSKKTLVDRTKEKQAAASKKDVDNLVQNLLIDD